MVVAGGLQITLGRKESGSVDLGPEYRVEPRLQVALSVSIAKISPGSCQRNANGLTGDGVLVPSRLLSSVSVVETSALLHDRSGKRLLLDRGLCGGLSHGVHEALRGGLRGKLTKVSAVPPHRPGKRLLLNRGLCGGLAWGVHGWLCVGLRGRPISLIPIPLGLFRKLLGGLCERTGDENLRRFCLWPQPILPASLLSPTSEKTKLEGALFSHLIVCAAAIGHATAVASTCI